MTELPPEPTIADVLARLDEIDEQMKTSFKGVRNIMFVAAGGFGKKKAAPKTHGCASRIKSARR